MGSEPTEITKDGIQIWINNKNGNLHRENGPAVIHPDGRQFWYIDGNLHREDGPAMIGNAGKILEWFKHGFRHREDGPAIIEYDECGNLLYETWYMNNAIHREHGPAYTNHFTGEFAYYCRGYLHRTDGVSQYKPRLPRLKSYHIHGKYVTDKFRKWCIDMNCVMCDENFQVFIFEYYAQGSQ